MARSVQGVHVDGVVSGAIGRDDEQVRRVLEKFGAGMIVPHELIAGRTGLISMRGREHGFCRLGHAAVIERVEPHVVAPAEDVEITARHVRGN